MWLQFIGQNVHFALHLFAALTCLGASWLIFDAWTAHRPVRELLKWLGFAVLGLSFMLQATVIEQSVLGSSLFGSWSNGISIAARLLGIALLIAGQLLDPLQAVPNNEGLKLSQSSPKAPGIIGVGSVAAKLLLPLGNFAVASLYWRRATTGMERHLKPVAKAFLLFAVYDTLSLHALARSTANPVIGGWVAAFGWLWWLSIAVLVLAVAVLGRWVWGYLVERFFSQIFMILTSMVVVIFLLVSVGFTGLLLNNFQSDALTNLHSSASTLEYAIQSKQAVASSAAEQLAGTTSVQAGVQAKNHDQLAALTSSFLVDKDITDFIITDAAGQVMVRGQDSDRWGDSLSDDPLVRRALLDLPQATVVVRDGVQVPVVQVRAAAVIKDGTGTIIGTVTTMYDLDSVFVDGIAQQTGLQSSLYAGSTLSATTLAGSDQKTRPVGVTLSNKVITSTVLAKGQSYKGQLRLQNRQMLGAFLPLKDVDTAVIGMLMVAQPQNSILKTAGRSVEITFLLAAALIVLSFIPTFLVTRSIARQLN